MNYKLSLGLRLRLIAGIADIDIIASIASIAAISAIPAICLSVKMKDLLQRHAYGRS